MIFSASVSALVRLGITVGLSAADNFLCMWKQTLPLSGNIGLLTCYSGIIQTTIISSLSGLVSIYYLLIF